VGGTVFLKAGFERPLKRRHPWIFSGAVARVDGEPQPGETVGIRTSEGQPVGLGAYSPHSQIALRVWTFDPEEVISRDFFRSRLIRAIHARRDLTTRNVTAYRLVNAESDGLPGFVVDRYADFLVCQFLSAGPEYWRGELVAQLAHLLPSEGIYERSDTEVREKEGLQGRKGVLAGREPPGEIEIQEGVCRFVVDVLNGQKTGFYLDQRDNRVRVGEFAGDREVLNCFAYTGAFGIWALKDGAVSVTNVESSASALAWIARNVELNGLEIGKVKNIEGDTFQVMRKFRDSRRSFDVVILDPPKFVTSRSHLARASRGYKDINLLAFKLLNPGGYLFTFSCSGLMSAELFQKIVADAALDAGRDAQLICRLSQASDHPTALNFPEGLYLKGLGCRVW